MKRRRIGLFSVSAGIFFAAASGVGVAEIRDDVHVQSNSDAIRLDIDSRTFNEMKSFFERGYPTASVMLHGITQGLSIEDVTYIAVKAKGEKSQEIYQTAISLLPNLPGYVCRGGKESGLYPEEYPLQDLGPQPTIAEVAKRYFDGNRRLTPFPNWQTGGHHMMASTEELANLAKDQWWYRPGAAQNGGKSQIFVSLYPDNREIVIDSGVNRIRDSLQKGVASLPVVIVYNDNNHRPVSRYGGKPKMQDVANDYFSAGYQLTAVPLWEGGDHHLLAPVDDLKSIFNPPAKKDIPAARYDALAKELSGGFKKPFLMTLLGTGCGCAYIDDPARLTVASDLNMKEAPVVMFYHDLDRLPCGAPASCQERICEAVVAAGGDPSACTPPPGAILPGRFTGQPAQSTVPFAPPPPPPASPS
jgi:hypothetical protein